MNIKPSKLRWPGIIIVLAMLAGAFIYQTAHFTVDTDVVASLPQNDPVLSDARFVIRHLPFQDRVVIDLSLPTSGRDSLVEGADFVESRLNKSGLFKNVGIDKMQELFPGLINHIVASLSVMFTDEELEEKIKPLLSAQNIKNALSDNIRQLQNLEGIGQSEFIINDPLGFKNVVLAKLAGLAPSGNASVYKGKLLSSDDKHLLIIAELMSSGTEIKTAEMINSLIGSISADIKREFGSKGLSFKLNPVGAYRAVLDNQTISKKDTERAVTISTIVIAVLLILGFPRPLIGLLALVPSIMGTVIAFIVYSLLHNSISILAFGFGGAIISFTVDYGITYLIFLDRPYKTYGLKATKEVWSLGLLAMLTTAASFAFLSVSGFTALAQIGEFAALGVVFTYICVHVFFPVVFPVMRPAKRKGILPLHNFTAGIISSSKGKYKLPAVMIFCIIMLFFAKPEFHVDLNSMNTVSKETLVSEELVKKQWGDITDRVYLMTQANSMKELRQKGDTLTGMLEKDIKAGRIASAFLPAMIFPGEERAKNNFTAWKEFWTRSRVKELRYNINKDSLNLGFAKNAFKNFFDMIEKNNPGSRAIPQAYLGLFGITHGDKDGWSQFSILKEGKGYDPDKFYSRYSSIAKIFDSNLFSKRLGKTLLSGFINMAIIIGIITIMVAFIYLVDLQLTLVSLLPTLFALICTFGTLKIFNQPLGIPVIMVTVVVIGMGTDYGLYIVRAYQRYMDEKNQSLKLVHISVFLSFATTFAGFGVLAMSDHSMLKSAGLCLALGIGYSFIGAILIIPPLLSRIYRTKEFRKDITIVPGSKEHFRRVLSRYKHMESYPRFFARFKILFDPMFPALARFVVSPKKIIDIGSGYGVPAAWLLALNPDARVHAFEPDARRAEIAAKAMGTQGVVVTAGAPGLPALEEKGDTVLLLDIIHYLSNDDLRKTLNWIKNHLISKGKLIIRVTIPSAKKFPWERRIENLRVRLLKTQAYFRSAEEINRLLKEPGFIVRIVEPARKNREETWIIAEKDRQPLQAP